MRFLEDIREDLRRLRESRHLCFWRRRKEEIILLRRLVATQKLEMERLREAVMFANAAIACWE